MYLCRYEVSVDRALALMARSVTSTDAITVAARLVAQQVCPMYIMASLLELMCFGCCANVAICIQCRHHCFPLILDAPQLLFVNLSYSPDLDLCCHHHCHPLLYPLKVGAKAIVVFTTTGSTVLRASRDRPTVPILAFTASDDTARYLQVKR